MSIPRRRRNCNSARKNEVWPAVDLAQHGLGAARQIWRVRRDGNDFLKKLGKEDVSEDEIKELEDQLQKLTDKFGKDIDKLVEAKSKEIMTV